MPRSAGQIRKRGLISACTLALVSGCDSVRWQDGDIAPQVRLTDVAGTYHPAEDAITLFRITISERGRFRAEVEDCGAYWEYCGTVVAEGRRLILNLDDQELWPGVFLPDHPAPGTGHAVTVNNDGTLETADGTVWIRGFLCLDCPAGHGAGVLTPCPEEDPDESAWCT